MKVAFDKTIGKFVFRGATVLVGWSGLQVSLYTPEGGDVLLKDNFKWFH